MNGRVLVVIGFGLALYAGVGCGDGSSGKASPALLAPEGNRLRVFTLEDEPRGRVLLPSHGDDPATGRDINGEVCFEPGTRRFVAGEDTGQPNPPPAWGLFELAGSDFESFTVRQVGRLVTTFQGEPGEGGVPDTADPFGCGFLPDGRLLTTDIGNTASGPGTGQLVLWFPPLDAAAPRFCKLDVAIGTAGTIFIDDQDTIYVASARVEPGIHRYRGALPTSDDAAGGCGRRDATGAPLADDVQEDLFLAAGEIIPTPNGVAGSGRGTFYVSSIVNGVIAEFDADGRFLRTILEPPPGEALGPEPYSTGTPLGLTVDPGGTIYFADLGLVLDERGIGPRSGAGSVRRIRFRDGVPLPPETLGAGFSFPDGLGLFEP